MSGYLRINRENIRPKHCSLGGWSLGTFDRRARQDLWKEREGTAYVEFLIAFLPLFILFLGMVQMALMYAGDLVVQHAATTATRAAVVVLDDDPQYYDDESRRTVSPFAANTRGDVVGQLIRLIGGAVVSAVVGPSAGGPRYQDIRLAASIPLMAISPSLPQLMNSDSVRDALGNPASRAATGALLYNRIGMNITFPDGPGSSSYRTYFRDGSQVTTRVTYVFHCGVPLASRLMCETFPTLRLGPAAGAAEDILRDLGSGDLTYEDAMERLGRVDETRRRHERDNEAIGELGLRSLPLLLTWGTGSRFKILRGEGTMPLQMARYRYPSECTEGSCLPLL